MKTKRRQVNFKQLIRRAGRPGASHRRTAGSPGHTGNPNSPAPNMTGRLLTSPRLTGPAVQFVFLFLAALLLSSCVWIYGPEMAVPENLSATTAETDKIILAWDSVENGDIYYIYRSPSAGGVFGYHAFSYTAEYTDTDIDPEVAYYYKVTASDLESNNESPRTAAVMGDSIHDFAWSQTAILSTTAGLVRICADPAPGEGSHDEYRAWAILAGDTPGSPAEVHGYNSETDVWEVFGEPFGSIAPSVPGSIDVSVYAGEVFAAYADTGYGGRITVKRYDWTGGTWINTGTTGPGGISGTDDARHISLEVAPDADNPLPELVWIAYDGSNYTVFSTFYDGTADSWPSPVPLSTGSAGTDPYVATSTIRTGTYLIAAFEDESGTGDRIKLEKYDGGGWNTIPSTGGLPSGGTDVLDGYFSLAGFSDTELYLAYMTGASAFEVRQYDGSNWTTDRTPGSIAVSTAANGVGLASDEVDGDSFLYLFYRDALSGYVQQRDKTAGTWELLPVSTDTEEMALNPTYPETAAYNNIVFCAYMSGGSAQVRVWR